MKIKRKKVETEAAKQAAQAVIYSVSETEEDSPRNVEIHTARQVCVAGRGRSLFDELNPMSSKSAKAKQLGDKIQVLHKLPTRMFLEETQPLSAITTTTTQTIATTCTTTTTQTTTTTIRTTTTRTGKQL